MNVVFQSDILSFFIFYKVMLVLDNLSYYWTNNWISTTLYIMRLTQITEIMGYESNASGLSSFWSFTINGSLTCN